MFSVWDFFSRSLTYCTDCMGMAFGIAYGIGALSKKKSAAYVNRYMILFELA